MLRFKSCLIQGRGSVPSQNLISKEKKYVKKITTIFLSLLFVLSINAAACSDAEDNAQNNEYKVEIDENTSVTVIVPNEFAELMTVDEIETLVKNDNLSDGDIVNIFDVSDIPEAAPCKSILRAPYQYKTTKTKTASEKLDGTSYFIISVAKGETRTLSQEFSTTVNTTFEKDTPYVSIGVETAVTAKYAKTYQWTFPDMPATDKNSREFRVRFYYDYYTWTQVKTDLGNAHLDGTKSGTVKVPVRYASYSIDSKV